MGVRDLVNKVMIAVGLSLGAPTIANGFNPSNPGDWVNLSSRMWNQVSLPDTTAKDTTQSSGGNFGSSLENKWEQMMAKLEKAKTPVVQEQTKPANMSEVNRNIAALNAEVDQAVLNIVLPAWNLSPGTKESLQAIYGTGLSEYQYKQLLFGDEYNYAKIIAAQIYDTLGIKYNETDAKEFAVAYASMATLGYGIGRPNMNKAVDSAVATMQANVDRSQWTLTLVMQYLPKGIQTPQGYVSLDYPKSVIGEVYAVYGLPYVDYGSGISPVQAAIPGAGTPGVSGVYQPPSPQQPTQQPTQQQPTLQTQDQIKVENALKSINSAIKILQNGRQDEYNKKVNYYDPTIHYGWMLCVIKEPKSSTIDIILSEACGARLISYYMEDGKWKACLTGDSTSGATGVLKEKYKYKDEKINELNASLQKMADKRNLGAENFDTDLAKALEKAGISLVPYGGVLVDVLNSGGVEALQNQIANYQSLQSNNKTEIDLIYGQQIEQLYKLKTLVEKYRDETDPSKKEQILEEIGEFEAGMTVKLDQSVYEQLTGKKYTPKEGGVPSAEEVLGEQGREPDIGTKVDVGVGITADSVGEMVFQPSGHTNLMTIKAYLETLPVPEHTIFVDGVEVKATILTDEEIQNVLNKLAEDIKAGKIKKINEAEIKKAVKEATGLDVSKWDGELQDWKTVFRDPKRGWRCDGTPKNIGRV
ncbi:MAG: hypothetical protein ACP5JC_01380 [Candidatus Micrarchaeia archaeon]